MQKLISRVCCLCLVVLVIAACLPFSAFAVDPVSAGVMANAFAQAIAAYGASNGVALTFDVANTDGIGESVHELWKDFRDGTQSADDYATLAAALFPDLYYKASSAVAGAADVYTVGYNISSEYAEEFDNFYNWLLSGPAEMTKVDNQYFEWASSQPVSVYSFTSASINGVPVFSTTHVTMSNPYNSWDMTFENPVYCWYYLNGSNSVSACYFISSTSFTGVKTATNRLGTTTSAISPSLDSYPPFYTSYSGASSFAFSECSPSPLGYAYTWSGSTIQEKYESIFGPASPDDTIDTSTDDLSVKPYAGASVAEFPDTTDPNYDAVAKRLPSTVPWNDALYGDGTGALTDAQAGAIAGAADDTIVADGVLDLAGTREGTDEPGTDDPPSDDPDDYAVPGLADIFPFCIPFDIYNFLSALAAAPVAPHFTATLDFPEAVGGTQTIDIDFDSPTWNQLAQLLRLLELLAFIIGLALLTRSMFIRG